MQFGVYVRALATDAIVSKLLYRSMTLRITVKPRVNEHTREPLQRRPLQVEKAYNNEKAAATAQDEDFHSLAADKQVYLVALPADRELETSSDPSKPKLTALSAGWVEVAYQLKSIRPPGDSDDDDDDDDDEGQAVGNGTE